MSVTMTYTPSIKTDCHDDGCIVCDESQRGGVTFERKLQNGSVARRRSICARCIRELSVVVDTFITRSI